MFMGNPARTGVSDSILSLPLQLCWSTGTNSEPDLSSPTLAEGKLYVALKSRSLVLRSHLSSVALAKEDGEGGSSGENGVLAIDPATGKILWKFATQQAVNHSPAYEKGIICIAQVGGRVHGICAETGKKLWQHDLGDNISRWIYMHQQLATANSTSAQ